MPYMTDAANLRKVYDGAPTVVLGPGEAAMAHQTDEYCNMERIRQSVADLRGTDPRLVRGLSTPSLRYCASRLTSR